MKKLKFLITVPDKYTGKQYEAGQVYEFEDERAEEILKARTAVTHEPYAVEVEEITEEIVQAVAKGMVNHAKENNQTVEEVVNEIIEEANEVVEEKPKKTRGKKAKKSE